jgi:hypothetical protein
LARNTLARRAQERIAERSAALISRFPPPWSETKQMIAKWVEQLGWTKPPADAEKTAVHPSVPEAQVATVAQTVPAAVAPQAPEATDARNKVIQILHGFWLKACTPSTHPILGDELRALRRLQREQEPKSSFVFTSEPGSPFSTAGFARMVERAGSEARLGFKVHPHMLRHACGYALANRGHDTRALQAYLGHKNIQHTVRYTELSPLRFKDFWRT